MGDGRAIDHVVLVSENLEQTAKQYESLGFTLTPRARHEDSMGTSNRLAQFSEHNFVELLEVDRPDLLLAHDFESDPPFFSFGAHNRDWVGHQPGMSMLVFAGQDSRADHARFKKAGIQTYKPFDFERKATMPDGSRVTVSFRLTYASSEAMPAIAFFVCQNCAPEHFWKPAYQDHANCSTGIESVYIASQQTERDAEFIGRLFGGSVITIDGGFRVENEPGQYTQIVDPEYLRNIDPAFEYHASIGPTLAGLVLRTNSSDQLFIDSSDGCGTFIQWRSVSG